MRQQLIIIIKKILVRFFKTTKTQSYFLNIFISSFQLFCS